MYFSRGTIYCAPLVLNNICARAVLTEVTFPGRMMRLYLIYRKEQG
jgi:hypothetical protein